MKPGDSVWIDDLQGGSREMVVMKVKPGGRVAACRRDDPAAWLTFPASMVFPSPTARNSDPATSHEAARIAGGRAAGDRLLVLRLLAMNPAGLTDHELAALAPFDERGRPRQQTSLGKRRGELLKVGLVAKAPEPGHVRPAPSGVMATVWRLTRSGREEIGHEVPARADTG